MSLFRRPFTNTTGASGTDVSVCLIEPTQSKEKVIQDLGFNLVTAWEYENPPKARRYFEKEFRPYPHYIVFDFEALLQALNQQPTKDLLYVSRHVPVSVAIHDSLSESPTFIEREDPEVLVQLFVEELNRRRALIVRKSIGCTRGLTTLTCFQKGIRKLGTSGWIR